MPHKPPWVGCDRGSGKVRKAIAPPLGCSNSHWACVIITIVYTPLWLLSKQGLDWDWIEFSSLKHWSHNLFTERPTSCVQGSTMDAWSLGWSEHPASTEERGVQQCRSIRETCLKRPRLAGGLLIEVETYGSWLRDNTLYLPSQYPKFNSICHACILSCPIISSLIIVSFFTLIGITAKAGASSFWGSLLHLTIQLIAW
jgi:hypothetical protein